MRRSKKRFCLFSTHEVHCGRLAVGVELTGPKLKRVTKALSNAGAIRDSRTSGSIRLAMPDSLRTACASLQACITI
jgi:hypothetical protein